MTNQEITRIAMRQSALESSCAPEDFLREEPMVVRSRANEKARAYLALPFDCDLTTYGAGVVASVRADVAELTEEYVRRYPAEHCFETPNLHVLNDGLQAHGLRICFMAEYFLPDVDRLKPLPCAYRQRTLTPVDFEALYQPEWSNALCEKRKPLDVLGVGAYDGERLIGLAGASADCEDMWQIGIDVLPQYRRQGVARALTSRLALDILERGKVPFYCAAWSNLKSVRNAIASGFSPAWVQMTAKPLAFVEEMNR